MFFMLDLEHLVEKCFNAVLPPISTSGRRSQIIILFYFVCCVLISLSSGRVNYVLPMWVKVIIQSPHVSCHKIIEVRHILQHWKIVVTEIIPFVSPQNFISSVVVKRVKLHSFSYIVPNRLHSS